jgi:hypothetical protein
MVEAGHMGLHKAAGSCFGIRRLNQACIRDANDRCLMVDLLLKHTALHDVMPQHPVRNTGQPVVKTSVSTPAGRPPKRHFP